MLGVLGCAPAKEEGDWVDKKWSGKSEEWKRGYRDYVSPAGEEYERGQQELKDIQLDIERRKAEGLRELARLYEAGQLTDQAKADLFARAKRTSEEALQKIAALGARLAAAKKKLEPLTDEHKSGWTTHALEIKTSVNEQQFAEEEQARKEGEHLKKVLEYAR
jgi:hypothetical protein